MKIDHETIGAAVKVRTLLNLDCNKPIDIFKVLKERNDFTIVFLPLGENIGGFSHNEKEHKIIVINATDPKNKQNFSCAHELFHLFFDYDKNCVYNESVEEKKADRFASYFLIPHESLYNYLDREKISNKITLENLCELERYFNVSRTALLVRLISENLITQEEYDNYSVNIKNTAASKGYNTDFYEVGANKHETYGEYITFAKKLYTEDKISYSKYMEYLTDAFVEE